MYVAVVAFVLLVFVGCGVLLSRKRRRQHGQLWFPEGFKVSEASKKKRREPLGEDSVGLKLVDAAVASGGLGGGRALQTHGPASPTKRGRSPSLGECSWGAPPYSCPPTSTPGP